MPGRGRYNIDQLARFNAIKQRLEGLKFGKDDEEDDPWYNTTKRNRAVGKAGSVADRHERTRWHGNAVKAERRNNKTRYYDNMPGLYGRVERNVRENMPRWTGRSVRGAGYVSRPANNAAREVDNRTRVKLAAIQARREAIKKRRGRFNNAE